MTIVARAWPLDWAGSCCARKAWAVVVLVDVTAVVVVVVVELMVVVVDVVVVCVVVVVVVGQAKISSGTPSLAKAPSTHCTNLAGHSTLLNLTFSGACEVHPHDANNLQPGRYVAGRNSHLSMAAG